MGRKYALYAGNLAYWQGGRWLLRLFARALARRAAARGDRIELLLPQDSALDHGARACVWLLRSIADVARGRRPAPLLLRKAPRDALEAVASGIEGPVEAVFCAPFLPALAAQLRRSGAEVLLPSATVLPADFPVPWVGYIPDLQHRYFPELFTPAEIAYRERQFGEMLDRAPCAIVNAASVKDDLACFFPGARARIFELPFAPMLEALVEARAADAALARHEVRTPFFIVSNQFWVHKNHLTAFRALRRLGEAHGRADVQLVCTGATADYRSSAHFRHLAKELEALGLRDRVRILGHIPRAEYLALLSRAAAAVQPTLFEGGPGGGAAYDAVSLGVPVLASDIPVNREIDAEQVAFFPARDEKALAALMARVLAEPPVRPRELLLQQRSLERSERLAERLAEAAEFAIAAYRKSRPIR